MIAISINHFKISKLLLNGPDDDYDRFESDKRVLPQLYRTDYKGRTLLDQCKKYHADKRITNYIKKLLYVNIHSTIESIYKSKEHDIVPYVPRGVVQFICVCTY